MCSTAAGLIPPIARFEDHTTNDLQVRDDFRYHPGERRGGIEMVLQDDCAHAARPRLPCHIDRVDGALSVVRQAVHVDVDRTGEELTLGVAAILLPPASRTPAARHARSSNAADKAARSRTGAWT
jgi:hypothetical protein